MKYFSILIVFAMIFACLPVAQADVALPPRDRNVQSDFITADIDDRGKLSVKFDFPSTCDYEYQLIGKKTGKEIHSGNGSVKKGDVVEEFVDLPFMRSLSDGRNFFVLKMKLSNIREKTPFGTKIRSGNVYVTKTILVEVSFRQNKIYGLYIDDGEND